MINPNSYAQAPMYPGCTGEGAANLCLRGLGKTSQNWSCRTTKSVTGWEWGQGVGGGHSRDWEQPRSGVLNWGQFCPLPQGILSNIWKHLVVIWEGNGAPVTGVRGSPGGDPMDSHPPGSSYHGIFQVRILALAAVSYSRGSSQPRDRTCVFCSSCTGRQILYHCTT